MILQMRRRASRNGAWPQVSYDRLRTLKLIPAATQAHRSMGRAPIKMYDEVSLGLHSQSLATPNPSASLSIPAPSIHTRQTSAGSEFPMRADSYSAREIPQRVIDPSDQPTSLPPNLPYPQLQQQVQHGMKQSQSMQSVTSVASKKGGGFFSHMGRKGGKKESISLVPPGPAPRKDVRGLSISDPRSSSPQSVADTATGGLSAPRVQPSVSAPMGPRGPKMGSYTPPTSNNLGRSSLETPGPANLDAGLSRINTTQSTARASIDSARSGKASLTARSPTSVKPKEEDVRSMADILPQVERGVLRAYLAKYGDQMRAIG